MGLATLRALRSPSEGAFLDAGGRTARIDRDGDGRLVSRGETPVTDDAASALFHSGCR